jgi:hypothetical protein
METPTRAPAELRAGDTAKWTRSLADYPATAGWTLSYTAVGATAAYSFSAAASGDDHAVTVAAATTATYTPGTYQLTEHASLAGERYTLATTTLRVLPDLAAVGAGGADVRSHARKVLDLIEAWLETKAPVAASYEIAGKKLAQYPLPELLALRDKYRAEVRAEDRAAAGFGPARILTRF